MLFFLSHGSSRVLYFRQRTKTAIHANGGRIPLSHDYVMSIEHTATAGKGKDGQVGKEVAVQQKEAEVPLSGESVVVTVPPPPGP